MKISTRGLSCSKCGNVVHTKKIEVTKVKRAFPEQIFIVDSLKEEHPKVNHTCPQCGNGQAYNWISYISGEHAGVKQERTVEHFKCVKCQHLWAESH